MDQLRMPDVIEDAENQEREAKFLRGLESDSVAVEFPRKADETYEFLLGFTKENPEHSFMLFETEWFSEESVEKHLIRTPVQIDLPISEQVNEFEHFVHGLFNGSHPEVVLMPFARDAVILFHDGMAYFAGTRNDYRRGFAGFEDYAFSFPYSIDSI